MEIVKFNAFDTEGKLVYCSYRKFEKGEKGTQIERSLPFDKFMSQINWSVQRGKLIGGLTNIKGVGLKVAEDIINRRIEKINLTPRQEKLLNEGTTPYDDIFECERRFGHIKKEPETDLPVSKPLPGPFNK